MAGRNSAKKADPVAAIDLLCLPAAAGPCSQGILKPLLIKCLADASAPEKRLDFHFKIIARFAECLVPIGRLATALAPIRHVCRQAVGKGTPRKRPWNAIANEFRHGHGKAIFDNPAIGRWIANAQPPLG